MHQRVLFVAGRCVLLALFGCFAAACEGKSPAAPAATSDAPPGAPASPASAPPSPAELPTMPAGHPPLMSPVPSGPAPAESRVASLPPGTVLATAGAHRVTAGDLDAAIMAMPLPDRMEYAGSDNIRELLDSLVDRKLMADVARSEGLAADPVVKQMLGKDAPPGMTEEQVLAGVWLETALAKAPPPGEAEVSRYYRDHAAEFHVPARLRVTRAVAADEAAAGLLREALGRGATLAQLRERIPGKASSVEDLWLQDTAKKPESTAIALRLQTGQVSDVLPLAGGFAVFRVEERAPARERPLDEVRPGIRAQLQETARREELDKIRVSLRKNVAVEVDEQRLASYLPPVHPGS